MTMGILVTLRIPVNLLQGLVMRKWNLVAKNVDRVDHLGWNLWFCL